MHGQQNIKNWHRMSRRKQTFMGEKTIVLTDTIKQSLRV